MTPQRIISAAKKTARTIIEIERTLMAIERKSFFQTARRVVMTEKAETEPAMMFSREEEPTKGSWTFFAPSKEITLVVIV